MNWIKNLIIALSLLVSSVMQAQELLLQYSRPASVWQEALPLGNSRIGAMVFGGVQKEQLQLNEETFWGGGPHNNCSTAALAKLPEVRKLIFDGKNKEAQDLIEKTFRTKHNGMPYQTIGSLMLSFSHSGEVSDYKRELDLQKAIVTTTYHIGDVKYRRETFTSFADDVVVMRLTANTNKAISFQACFETPVKAVAKFHRGRTLVLRGKGQDHEGIKGMVRMETQLYVANDGGKVSINDSILTVKNANSVTLYLSLATNFCNYQDVSGDEEARTTHLLRSAIKCPYEQALAKHIQKYRQQFDRVSFLLPETQAKRKDTDLRVRDFVGEGNDTSLPALMFNFDRYLLICSSQPEGQPANLQGIWNKDLLAPWDGKYTININTEMNYWMAEKTNLSECHTPLIDFLRNLSKSGAETARTMYGCRGWMSHHNTDIWCSSGEVDAAFYGMWPNGGGWLSTHLWQRFLYTGDYEFLKSVYSVIKGAARFYVDYMVRHPLYGWLVTTPSLSPEHGPGNSENSNGVSVVAGCTMDNQITFDVLSQALQSARLLDVEKAWQDTLVNVISQLPPMQVGRYNQLQEWLEDVDDPNDHHRHISHLYGLFPSAQISPYTHPLLFQAARNSLLQRGDEATGWSIGWKINLWARLLDGNHAYRIIQNMLKLLPSDAERKKYPEGRTYPNLFDAHPPFQIDGNLGYVSGVVEMLMQSHDGALHLLPALPDKWSEGSIRGLVARGGFVVSMEWQGGQLLKAKIHSRRGGLLRIRSYIPLKGEGLRMARGENDNPFYLRPAIKKPLVSAELKYPQMPILPQVYEYDIDTQAGADYIITR